MIFTLKSLVSCLLVIAVIVTIPVRASQKDKEADQQKELEKKTVALLNEVASGAWSLKLPENRLFIMSGAADLLWSVDEKRARTIYWDALNALNLMIGPARSTAQKLSDDERMKLVQNYLSAFGLRQKLLRQVAKRDGQLALDMLRASRPVPPRNVMPDFTLPDDVQLEQAIATELAAHDPAQALQIARQSLAKGLTLELLNLLLRLNDADQEKGSQFAGEIIAKLRTTDLATDVHAAFIAVHIVQYSRKPDPDQKARLGFMSGGGGARVINLDDDTKRDLVEVLVNAMLSTAVAPYAVWQLRSVMPEIERFFPERREAIARKLSAFNRGLNKSDQDQNASSSLITGGSVEDIVRLAPSLDSSLHSSMYAQAAIMAVAQGKADWFREALNKQEIDESVRAHAIDTLDYEEISSTAMRKQVDQLQKILPKIRRKEERARAMAELAIMLHEKGEKEDASALLDEAATLIKTDLNDEKQTNSLLTLLCAYAVIDPQKAFTLAERTVDRANRQISLLLLVDKVVKSGAIKKNEILLEQPQLMTLDFLVFKYGKGVAALAKADFNRTKALAERFDRNELRLMAQLFVLRGLLEPQTPATAGSNVASVGP